MGNADSSSISPSELKSVEKLKSWPLVTGAASEAKDFYNRPTHYVATKSKAAVGSAALSMVTPYLESTVTALDNKMLGVLEGVEERVPQVKEPPAVFMGTVKDSVQAKASGARATASEYGNWAASYWRASPANEAPAEPAQGASWSSWFFSK